MGRCFEGIGSRGGKKENEGFKGAGREWKEFRK